MANNKLPAYFEKYFEQKFGELNSKIEELRRDAINAVLAQKEETQNIYKEVKSLKKQLLIVWVVLSVLLIIHVDQLGPVFLASLKKFIGI